MPETDFLNATTQPADGDNGPFPGWYIDPKHPEDERFWNGNEWTNHTRAAAKLADFLGPIEPTLLALLGEADGPAVGDTEPQANDPRITDAPVTDQRRAELIAERASFDKVVAFMAN